MSQVREGQGSVVGGRWVVVALSLGVLLGCGGGNRRSTGGEVEEDAGPNEATGGKTSPTGMGGKTGTGGNTGAGGSTATGGSTGTGGNGTGGDSGLDAAAGTGDQPDADVSPDAASRPTLPTAAVPEPWKSEDIGMVGMPGGAGRSRGRFHVKGSGSDVWGMADNFNYLYRPVSGDLEIVAKLVSQERTSGDAKAGIMLRETTAPDARNAFMLAFASQTSATGVVSGKGTRLQFRDKRTDSLTGYADSKSLAPPAPDRAPIWLRLVKKGMLVTGSISDDGDTWIEDGFAMVPLPAQFLAGLAVTAHADNDASLSVFESMRITALTDPTWAHTEVGTLGGYATGRPAKFEIQTAGRGLANDNDGVTFLHKLEQHTGDVEITGRVTDLTYVGNGKSRAGFSLRSGLASGARMVSFVVELSQANGQRYFLVRRSGDGGDVSSTAGMIPGASADAGVPADTAAPGDAGAVDAAPPPPVPLEEVWLKLVRVGNRFVGFINTSANGRGTWTKVVDLPGFVVSSNAYVGVMATSGNEGAVAGASIENVTIVSPPTTMLPPIPDAAAPADATTDGP
jgi:hypothetical protein